MRRFRYLHDRLFLLACVAYVVNRWFIKPHFSAGFFHSYFSDVWLIPCALPPVLWLHRRLGLRSSDAMPRWSEIALHLICWSVMFEWIGPRLVTRAIGDPWDVVAYASGAVIAGFWWALI